MERSEDELLMAECIGTLQDENARLKRTIRDLEYDAWHERSLRYFENIPSAAILYACAIACCFGLGICIYKTAISPTTVESCIVQKSRNSDMYNVIGLRPWKITDVTMGKFKTFEEAVKGLKLLDCPFEPTPKKE